MRIDYARALDGRDATLTLSGGRKVTIKQLRLGDFIKLRSIEPQLLKALKTGDVDKVAECYESYLTVAAPGENISGRDLFHVQTHAMYFNQLSGTMPFMEMRYKKDAPPYDYPNRNYALIVHEIASHYHWSKAEIMQLTPDEAYTYLQEIMIADYHEREWDYQMNGFGSSPLPNGGSKINPYPAPDWAVGRADSKEIKKSKINKSMLPQGGIVDLGGFGLHGSEYPDAKPEE